MRSVVLAALAGRLAHIIAVGGRPMERDYERAEELAPKVAFLQRGKATPYCYSDAIKDPYFGIATRNRRGVGLALELQQIAFARTTVGKRNGRGRALSNPFKHPERRKAFDEAVVAVRKAFPTCNLRFARTQAQSIARRVPVAKKGRAR